MLLVEPGFSSVIDGRNVSGRKRSKHCPDRDWNQAPPGRVQGGQQSEQADEYFQLSKNDFLRKKFKIIKQLV